MKGIQDEMPLFSLTPNPGGLMRYLTIIFCVLLVLFSFHQAQATICHVPGDSSTIQACINGAVDGDTILVADGHYYERINFYGKAILVTSEFMNDGDTLHIQNTIIDADTSVIGPADTGSVVCFVNDEDSTSILQGFTIRGGTGTPSDAGGSSGGGVYCNSSDPTIRNCILTNNSASYGGGLFCIYYASPTLIECDISDDTADTGGGGVGGRYGGTPQLIGCVITNNSAPEGSGIWCKRDFSPNIQSCRVENNSDGIYCNDYPELVIQNSALLNTEITGRYFSVTIIGSKLDSSGISGVYCSAYLRNDTLFDSHVWVTDVPGTTINRCILIRSEIHVCNAAAYVDSSLITGRIWTFGGAGCSFYGTNLTILGEGIDLLGEESSATLENCIIVTDGGPAISCHEWDYVRLTCCDIFGYEGDSWLEGIPYVLDTSYVFTLDPLFCDTANGDFGIYSYSPCAPNNNDCGVLIGAFGIGCGWVLVTAGDDQSGPANSQVSVFFYIHNMQDSTDTFELDVSDQLGWNIEPTHYEVVLDSGQVDTVDFTVSIPPTPLGTVDSVRLDAVSRNDSTVYDSAYLTVTCDSYNITITDISDVGNDQGKQVHIDWTSFPGSDPLVTDFSVFRRKDSLLTSSLATSVVDPALPLTYPPGEWGWLVTIPAFGETLYSVVVPTLKDSTIVEGMYWSIFFVRAGTDNPTIYFDSPIDSGYSLDNLSPSPPTGLLASHEPAVTKLTWTKCSDLDFNYYTLYRDTTSEFEPSLNNRLAFTIDTVFIDSTAELGRTYYYLVSAIDFSGNESDASNEATGIRYITGDANADGDIDIADVVYLVNYLFIDGPAPEPLAAGDANCDGKVDIADVVYLINYLFIGGPPPCEP